MIAKPLCLKLKVQAIRWKDLNLEQISNYRTTNDSGLFCIILKNDCVCVCLYLYIEKDLVLYLSFFLVN